MLAVPGRSESASRAAPSTDTLTAPLVDFLTVVIPPGALKKSGVRCYRELFDWIFGTGSKVAMGAITDRAWQFHEQSAVLIDETGEIAGRVGFKQDSGNVCMSLSGQGTRHVEDLQRVEHRLGLLDAWITRLDIAVDDLAGGKINVHQLREAAAAGEFVTNGRPPNSRFVSDEGSGKGCTLYVGQKGHKELCVYEKGKQLGDPTSSYTRCELRLYAKHVCIPLTALTQLRAHFAGAYALLAEFVAGEATRLLAKETVVQASGIAMVRYMRQNAGTALQLILDAFTDESLEFILKRVARPGTPGRFKGVARADQLPMLIRNELTRETTQ